MEAQDAQQPRQARQITIDHMFEVGYAAPTPIGEMLGSQQPHADEHVNWRHHIAFGKLLGDDALRRAMATNAYALGRPMIWRRNVEAAMREFAACVAAVAEPPGRPSLEHAEALDG